MKGGFHLGTLGCWPAGDFGVRATPGHSISWSPASRSTKMETPFSSVLVMWATSPRWIVLLGGGTCSRPSPYLASKEHSHGVLPQGSHRWRLGHAALGVHRPRAGAPVPRR